jgi:HEAT repeat protein
MTRIEQLYRRMMDPTALSPHRIGAVEALGAIEDPIVVHLLLRALLLPHASKVIRDTASGVLEDRGEGSVAYALTHALKGQPEELFALRDPRAIDVLLWALRADIHREADAAELLGPLADPRAVQPLVDLLRTSGRAQLHARRKAAVALGQIGDSTALEPLVEALQFDDTAVRCDAAAALAQLGDEDAVPHLRRGTKDFDPEVRAACREALKAMGHKPRRWWPFGS